MGAFPNPRPSPHHSPVYPTGSGDYEVLVVLSMTRDREIARKQGEQEDDSAQHKPDTIYLPPTVTTWSAG